MGVVLDETKVRRDAYLVEKQPSKQHRTVRHTATDHGVIKIAHIRVGKRIGPCCSLEPRSPLVNELRKKKFRFFCSRCHSKLDGSLLLQPAQLPHAVLIDPRALVVRGAGWVAQ